MKIEDFHFSDSLENINYHCTYPKCIAVVSFHLVRDFGINVSFHLVRDFGINHMIVRSNIVQMGCNYSKSSLDFGV